VYQQESAQYSNISASTGAFRIELGGRYSVAIKATWNMSGTVKFQQLGPDNTTFLDQLQPFDNGGTEQDDVISTFTQDGVKVFDLAPGQYQFAIDTATAVYAVVARVPLA